MKELSIVLPVFNEANSIEFVLREWQKELIKHKISYDFLICEDGSTDGTKEILLKVKRKYHPIMNQRRERRGYTRAVLDGLKSAHSRFVLCIDSDGQCDPVDFAKFWKKRHQADVLIGRRVKRADTFNRKFISFWFRLVFRYLFPSTIHDPSAPFVLFQQEKIKNYIKHLSYLYEGFWWGFVALCVKKKISIMLVF